MATAITVYLLRCADGTLYCGWTVDVERRLAAHNAGRASRYTRARLPVALAWSAAQPDRTAAMREELRIKRLPRAAKLALIAGLGFPAVLSETYRILVAEQIADAGVELLRERFSVDVATGLSAEELADRIGGYHGVVIRSATQLTAEVIGRADRLRVIGRAGIGVDNVDVVAATKRGIVVANAPQSNIVAAAEHTIALMLALARNIPQAHGSLTAGRWERSRFAGVEVYEKTLGVLGFGRIGQLVAARARAFGMRIVAFDPFVSAERFRELGAEKANSSADLYAQADFVTLHLPRTSETRGWLDAEAFGQMRDGVRIVNCARGELVDDRALQDALDSGKVAGVALDVFPSEPITDYPLFEGYPNVVVTPHLGASTTEAQDRAGVQTAEQVVAALTGGVVSTAVNIPAISAEDMDVLGPFLPLVDRLGRLVSTLAPGVDRIEVEYFGRIAERDTRLLTLAVLQGVLTGHTEDEVNLVNAPSLADERGIAVSERKEAVARDFTDLVRIAIVCGADRYRVAGTTLGRRHRPHLLEAWGQRFNLQLDEGAHLALFRYPNRPGMLGRVGSLLGARGINISSATQGVQGSQDDLNVVIVVTDAGIPDAVMREVLAEPGVLDGRTLAV